MRANPICAIRPPGWRVSVVNHRQRHYSVSSFANHLLAPASKRKWPVKFRKLLVMTLIPMLRDPLRLGRACGVRANKDRRRVHRRRDDSQGPAPGRSDGSKWLPPASPFSSDEGEKQRLPLSTCASVPRPPRFPKTSEVKYAYHRPPRSSVTSEVCLT